MPENAGKDTIRDFEETDSLDVAQGRGRHVIKPAIVEELPITTGEASASFSNDTVSDRSLARALGIPWITVL